MCARRRARRRLEGYLHVKRNQLQTAKPTNKFEHGNRENIETAVQEALHWLEMNQNAEKHKFEAKQKEIEDLVCPREELPQADEES